MKSILESRTGITTGPCLCLTGTARLMEARITVKDIRPASVEVVQTTNLWMTQHWVAV